MAKFRDDPIKSNKVVTGSTLAYFKQKQDEANASKFAGIEYESKVDTLETKVDGIETGAQVNKIEYIKLNGADLTITDKRVDLGSIATSEALEELTTRVTTAEGNISSLETSKQDVVSFADGYDASTNKAATVKTVTDAVAEVTSFEFEIVTELPSTGKKGIIYLKKHSESGSDMYEEFIWVNNRFEKIGDTRIDLSNYYTKTETDSAITNAISAEETRAREAEQANASNIAAEVTRAKAAEGTNASNISALTTRVETAEGEIDTLQSDMTTAKSNITALQGKVGDEPVEDQIEAAIDEEKAERESSIATAKSEAISEAATDATTKANAAQSAAEATAAADATSKANTAETNAIASAKTYTDTEVAKKQDILTPGANIAINGTEISATDTKYTAGTNVTISASNVINVADMRYTHPAGSAASKAADLYVISTDSTSHVKSATAATYSDLPISAENLRNTLEVVTTTEIDSWF